MDIQAQLDALNAQAPQFIKLMGGRIIDVNPEKGVCTFEFNIGTEFCHSVDVVQGGFTTAMLDAAMSHALFSSQSDVVNVSSLEIKTSYLATTRAGKLKAVGEIIKLTYKTAFLEASLYNEAGELTAKASSVAKVVRAK